MEESGTFMQLMWCQCLS